MSGIGGWTKVLIIAGAALSAAACASYPTEPTYSTRADVPNARTMTPQPTYPAQPLPSSSPAVINEAPPPARAPIALIEGGALPSASITSNLNGGPSRTTPSRPASVEPRPVEPAPYNPPAYSPPAYEPPAYTPPRSAASAAVAGVGYVIQPGDTISGVGRRFQTPVQVLIDLNALGPRGAISSGQRLVLPETAVDTGSDPYATGPAPVGVSVPRGGVMPPPPAPPSGNAALPAASRPTSQMPAAVRTVPAQPVQPMGPAASPPVTPTPAPSTASTVGLQWPVRGEVVRRFGPVGVGERNNGINIAASAGAEVVASAAGRVAYVGDDVAGQGLMVVIVHRDGWRTVYAQLGSSTVENNADVRAGQQIGTVGLTAGDGRPSIHFETRRMQNDNPVAVDPLTVLPR